MIRERLRAEMERQNIDAITLAYLAGTTQSTVYYVLSGADTKVSTLARFARALNCSIASLIDESQIEAFLEAPRKSEALIAAAG